jgi:hypothetical protein
MVSVFGGAGDKADAGGDIFDKPGKAGGRGKRCDEQNYCRI